MKKFKKVAIQAAKEAGKIITKHYSNLKPSDIKKKSAHDIVTKVDMQANKVIKSLIHKNFPTHDILSEETGLEDNDSRDYFWTIDPLDGTTNFSINNPLHCTAISLSKGKKILLSIIYSPILREMYYAESGKGAYLNGKKISVNKINKLSDAIVLLGRTHNIKSRQIFFSMQSKLQKEVMNMRWIGSGSLDLAYVAAGRVSGCIFMPPELSKWDLLPGILLVREAGGKVLNFKGEEDNYFNGGLIAGNTVITKKLQNKIKKWK
ncbi:MAG: inositol monophosphatase family protein [Candidatus Kerfeldbacteria bacterium]|jgi:myo-inositol-1(or 4)-monophosphatase